MWTIISNASAVATLFLFVLYMIGHFWKIKISKSLLYENFQIEYLTDEELDYVENLIELSSDIGEVFSISSPNGIRKISIYRASYNPQTNKFEKEELLSEMKDINVNEKVYVKANIPCGMPNTYVELEKTDYIKISFLVAVSGRTGKFVKDNYKCKMTLRSWIYYLCS